MNVKARISTYVSFLFLPRVQSPLYTRDTKLYQVYETLNVKYVELMFLNFVRTY